MTLSKPSASLAWCWWAHCVLCLESPKAKFWPHPQSQSTRTARLSRVLCDQLDPTIALDRFCSAPPSISYVGGPSGCSCWLPAQGDSRVTCSDTICPHIFHLNTPRSPIYSPTVVLSLAPSDQPQSFWAGSSAHRYQRPWQWPSSLLPSEEWCPPPSWSAWYFRKALQEAGTRELYGTMSTAYITAELWLGAFASVLAALLPPRMKTFCLAIYACTIILIYSRAPTDGGANRVPTCNSLPLGCHVLSDRRNREQQTNASDPVAHRY